MACHCHAQPKTEDASLVDKAMWSLALSATRRSPVGLPPEYRGMTPDEALAVLHPTTPYLASKAWVALGMSALARGATKPNVSKRRFGLLGRVTPDQLPDVYLPILELVFQASVLAAKRFLIALSQLWQHGHSSPCGEASANTTYGSNLGGDTFLQSEVIVYRCLDEVAPLLDPRRWDQCSEMFKRTCRVADPPGCNPVYIDPNRDEKVGPHWKGIVYERAAVGPHESENLLSVVFDAPTRTDPRVHLDFSLYRSLTQRLGFWESPGMFRRDSGDLTAVAIQHDIPKGQKKAWCTKISVTKTIRYGRTTTWSGSSVVDYGELSNYLAPAVLTLWVSNLQLVVPCCPGRVSAGMS